jgi:hypothetical protein
MENNCFKLRIKSLQRLRETNLVFFHYISVLNCLSWNELKTDDQTETQAQTAIEQTSN